MRFNVKTPDVIHETYDDEVVIVNLDSGNYYSILRAGADIWNLLARGATADQTAELIAQSYDGERAAIERAVSDLVTEFQREGLIVSAERDIVPLNWESKNPRAKFETPSLQKYSDMQELLLLDPIHEVDESGWPSRSKTPETK